jgi:putative inorganic carbon (HCO3(-)) transporter
MLPKNNIAISKADNVKLLLSGAFFLIICCATWFLPFGWLALLTPIFLGLVYLSFFHQKALFFTLLLLSPASINLEEFSGLNLGLALPTEPILILLLLVIVGKILVEPKASKKIFSSTFNKLSIFYLLWIFVSAISAENPVVAIKQGVAQSWFIIPVLWGGTYFFERFKDKLSLFLVYTLSLTLIALATLWEHSWYGFTQQSSHFVPFPFFKDHTSYGAALALVFPFSFLALFNLSKIKYSLKFIAFPIFIILLVGLVFSYSRAAWISCGAALIFIGLIRLGMGLKTLVFSIFILLISSFYFQDEITIKLRQIRKDSSTEFAAHLQSVANISTDHSNLERINRWTAALEMGFDRPIFGYGAGNYQFEYAPFQHAENLTPISTNFGIYGNAHSEYLGRFAEQGFIGAFIFIVLMFLIIKSGIFVLENRTKNTWFYYAIFAGIFSYQLHAFLNNFLDQDKIAIPFWLMVAFIISAEKSLKNNAH